MRVALGGWTYSLEGEPNPVARAVAAAVEADGARRPGDASGPPDLLLLSAPLRLPARIEAERLLARAAEVGGAMAAARGGRVLALMPALGALPMRREPAASAQAAALLAGLRALAMRLGPTVLVNALGLGLIGEPPVSGDAAMAGHAALGRAGTVEEAVNAARFLCDPRNTYLTGQMLVVDGGWSTGFGRDF